ncbi:MAG: TonB-dependent receptor, partial [Deltaproteobacteria bacterium]|nr:TonB-dependent receptor [Deltaproteobacteria bacterium]
SSVEGAQYDFALQTHSLDVAAEHKSLSVGAATLAGGAGASASTQDNVYTGVPLIPNHRSFDVGVFGYERVQTQAIALEVGARYDHQGRRSFLSESAYARHEGRGTLSEDDCDLAESVARCGLAFDVGSVSVGALVHAVPDVLDVKLDLSSASRFPNGDELYMNGSAPTFPVYAAGDPSLGPETTWSLSPTVGLSLGWFEGELSGFFSYINDYIAFTPDLGPDGSPTFDVTIRGAYPRFSYRAVHSLFYGIDGGFTLGPQWPVSLRLGGSLVRGEELATGTPLPFVPADRIHGSVRWTPPHVGVLHEAFIELSGEYVFEQRHIDEAADLAPAPDAYFLLGAGAGARFHVRGENTLEVGIEGGNLLNARYRDYTSLRRYYADEPGLEVRLRLRFEFHQHPMQRSLDDSDPTPDPDHHPDDPPGGV